MTYWVARCQCLNFRSCVLALIARPQPPTQKINDFFFSIKGPNSFKIEWFPLKIYKFSNPTRIHRNSHTTLFERRLLSKNHNTEEIATFIIKKFEQISRTTQETFRYNNFVGNLDVWLEGEQVHHCGKPYIP